MNFEPGLCRCCGSLTKHRFINEIYFINGHNKVYSEIVEECFGLKFCNLDSGPTERLICGLCAIKLQDAHAFKKQVEECEKAYVGKLYGIKVDNIPVAASIKVVKVTRVLPKPPPKKKPCVVIKKTENLASKVKLQRILPKPSSEENDCVEIKNTDNKGVRKIRIRKQYMEPGSSLLKGYDTSDEDTLFCNDDEQEVKMEIEEIVIPDDPIAVEQDFKIMAKNILDEVNQEIIVTEATNTQNNPISLDTIKETIKLEPEEFDQEEIKKEEEMALDVEEMTMINKEIKSENEEINVEENSIEHINEDQIELEEKRQLRRSTRFRKMRVQCEMKTPKIRKNRVQCERTTPNIIDIDRIHMHNAETIVKYSYACPFKSYSNTIICFYCLNPFSNPTALRRHVLTHDDSEIFKVAFKLDKKRFSFIKVDITRIDCRLCEDNINSLTEFTYHIVKVHNIRYYTHCKAGVIPFKLLPNDEYICVDCRVGFTNFEELAKDTNRHYGNFMCDYCGDKFNEEETLMAHIVVHDDTLGMGPQSHVEEHENNLSGTDFSGSDDSEYIPQPEDTNNSAPSEKQADDDSDGSSDKDILYDSEEQYTSAPIFEKSEIPQTIEETEKTKDKKQSSPKKYKRKTYFCIFCKEPILNFARHIIRNHASQNDVQKIISYPKKSKIRKQLLTDLRKKGNYIRDAKNTAEEYLPCPFCLGYYKKKRLWLHRKKCDKKPEDFTSAIQRTLPANDVYNNILKLPPRGYQRKGTRCLVTDDQLEAAKLLISNGASKRKAASQVGLKESTLRKRLKVGTTAKSLGRFTTTFTQAQEEKICKYVKQNDHLYYGMTMISFRKMIYEYAELNNIPNRFNTSSKVAGRDWVYQFLKRYPELKLRQPVPTSIAKPMPFNKTQVLTFYDNLQNLYNKHNFAPSRIYNMDESSVNTVAKEIPKVIPVKGKKLVGKIDSAERGQTITLVCAMSATGHFVPPAFIFPKKRMQRYLLNNAPEGSIGIVSDSEYINTELFIHYLRHFKENVQPTKDNPVLLILNNNSSYISLAAVNICRDNGIHMLTLPPNSSHKMRPLDRGFFAPLKIKFAYECDKWLSHPGCVIGQKEVAQLVNEAFKKAASLSNTVSGFKVSGIWPIDRDIFSEEDFAASTVTDSIQATNIEYTVPITEVIYVNDQILQQPVQAAASSSRHDPLPNSETSPSTIL